MQVVARQQGNSVGITIPTTLAKLLNIEIGDNLNVELKGKKIIIEKKKGDEENV